MKRPLNKNQLEQIELAKANIIMTMLIMLQVICVYLVICQMELDKHCSESDSARCLLLIIYQHLETVSMSPDCFISALGYRLC